MPQKETLESESLFSDTTCKDRVAHQERILLNLWKNTVQAEENTKFLKSLMKVGVGTADVEAIIDKQLKVRKVNGTRFKRRKEMLDILLREKIDDAGKWERAKRNKRYLQRVKLEDLLGKDSRKYRN